MRPLVLFTLAAYLPWQAGANIGQSGDPATCPLLAQNLRMMQQAYGHLLQLNFSVGVPVHLKGITGFLAHRGGTMDISGTWNPANWERDGKPGYERNTSKKEASKFMKLFQTDVVYMSYNKNRGWWMIHPNFDLGPDGTQGWAIVEAPDAEFPHQIKRRQRWLAMTENGIEQKDVRVSAEPTPEFFLSMSALIDKNGDEVLEASEVADFNFGAVRPSSLEDGQDWIAQADQNNDHALTMREVADGTKRLAAHKMTKRWMKDTQVVEATLRLLQRETARVRESMPGSETIEEVNLDDKESKLLETISTSTSDDTANKNATNFTSEDKACPAGQGEAKGWVPFSDNSNCPFASTGNAVFEFGKAVLEKVVPARLLTW